MSHGMPWSIFLLMIVGFSIEKYVWLQRKPTDDHCLLWWLVSWVLSFTMLAPYPNYFQELNKASLAATPVERSALSLWALPGVQQRTRLSHKEHISSTTWANTNSNTWMEDSKSEAPDLWVNRIERSSHRYKMEQVLAFQLPRIGGWPLIHTTMDLKPTWCFCQGTCSAFPLWCPKWLSSETEWPWSWPSQASRCKGLPLRRCTFLSRCCLNNSSGMISFATERQPVLPRNKTTGHHVLRWIYRQNSFVFCSKRTWASDVLHWSYPNFSQVLLLRPTIMDQSQQPFFRIHQHVIGHRFRTPTAFGSWCQEIYFSAVVVVFYCSFSGRFFLLVMFLWPLLPNMYGNDQVALFFPSCWVRVWPFKMKLMSQDIWRGPVAGFQPDPPTSLIQKWKKMRAYIHQSLRFGSNMFNSYIEPQPIMINLLALMWPS